MPASGLLRLVAPKRENPVNARNPESRPAGNAADLFRQFRGRFRDVLQSIVQLQFIPFESPQLVEREHVHAFHVAQKRRMAGEFLNFFQIVRNARYQHIPQPHGLAEGGQAFRKLQCRAQFPSCQGAVPFRIPCLDIQQDQIRIRQHFFARIHAQMAGGVQAGVQAQFPAAFQHGTGKIRLEEGSPPERVTPPPAACKNPGNGLFP